MDSNFAFLAPHWPTLATRGAEAEALFYRDPHSCLMKLRYFLEALLATLMERERMPRGENPLEQMINLMRGRGVPEDLARAMHQLRMFGNDAAHEGHDRHKDAEVALNIAHRCASWAARNYLEIRDRLSFRYPPAGFHLANGYPAAYARLAPEVRAAAEALQARIQPDPGADGIGYAIVSGRGDSYVRSLACGDAHRMIFVIGPRRDVYILAHIDRTEPALAWAREMRVEVNPLTGALQIFAASASVEPDIGAGEPLFAHVSDDDLGWCGLPDALLPAVREVRSVAQLEQLRGKLPEEAFEALWAISHGRALEDLLEERLGARPEALIDPANFAAAAATPDARRRMIAITSPEELTEILEAPFEQWRIFLHPSHQALVEGHFDGPTRVVGGAGTGKTAVLTHRTRHLARHVFTRPDERLLVLTYTTTLAREIERDLDRLCGPERARIEVKHIHGWARDFLKGLGRPIASYPEQESEAAWPRAYARVEGLERPLRYVREEWESVLCSEGLRTLDEYLASPRMFRSDALPEAERGAIWQVFEAYREELGRQGFIDYQHQLVLALDLLTAVGSLLPFKAVLVDEGQDMGAIEYRLIRRMVPPGPNDIFMVGDPFQRIFLRAGSLSVCGIDVADRTFALKLNYRTTNQIQRWAERCLAGQTVDDFNGGRAELTGYTALCEGPEPEVIAFASADAELAFVVSHVKGLLEVDEPGTICLMAPQRDDLGRCEAALRAAGIDAVVLNYNVEVGETVHLCSMRRSKGLEFKHVVLLGLGEDTFPPRALGEALDEAELNRQRRLLYAAGSRARNSLLVTAVGRPSGLVPDVSAAELASLLPAAADENPIAYRV